MIPGTPSLARHQRTPALLLESSRDLGGVTRADTAGAVRVLTAGLGARSELMGAVALAAGQVAGLR